MTRRDWHDVYLVQDDSRRWADADVDAAEEVLGVRLPAGYRELMTTLGDGAISGLLRFIGPTELEKRQRFFRDLCREAWFFDEPDETLTQDHALESIMIADTVDGDLIIFHSADGQLYVLPRHLERTYAVGTDLWDLVAWFLDSGIPYRPYPFRYFESFIGPTEAVNGRGDRADLDRMTEAIASMGLHDAEERRERDCTFFVKAIGGYIEFQEAEATDVNVHLRYRTDRSPEVRVRVHDAAVGAGVTFGEPWPM